MSHLPHQAILEKIQQNPPLVDNLPALGSKEFEELLQPDSVDLRIGAVVAGGLERVWKAKDPAFRLPPGEMAIIITEESVNLSADIAGEVSARQSILNDGLLVLAAPHVDPGYSGPLTARVINLLDRPYRLAFGDPALTIRFYNLVNATDRPSPARVSRAEKLQKALRESRDTFNRLFLREEDLVLKKELRYAAFAQALQWLSLLIPALVVVSPFSLPFFWRLGVEVSSSQPALRMPVIVAAAVLLLPLLALYVQGVLRLVRFMNRRQQ